MSTAPLAPYRDTRSVSRASSCWKRRRLNSPVRKSWSIEVLEARRQLLAFRDVLDLRDDVEWLAVDHRGRATRSEAPRRNGPQAWR